MVEYTIIFSKKAIKDAEKLKSVNLDKKAKILLEVVKQNPYKTPPPYEKLLGNLSGYYSRRINITHRLVYKVLEEVRLIKVYRMWTHYE